MSKTWPLFSVLLIVAFGCTKSEIQKDVALTQPSAPNPLLNVIGTYRGEAQRHDERIVSVSGGGFTNQVFDTTYHSFLIDISRATDSSLFMYIPFLSNDTLNLKTNSLLNTADTLFWRSPFGKSSHTEYFHLFFRNDSLLGDILYNTGPMPHNGVYNLKKTNSH